MFTRKMGRFVKKLLVLFIVFLFIASIFVAQHLMLKKAPENMGMASSQLSKSSIPVYNYTMTPGVSYDWVNVTDGTQVLAGYDAGEVSIPLPFLFTFYDRTFDTVHLSAYGYLSFIDPYPQEEVNYPLPTNDSSSSFDPTDYILAPYWDELKLFHTWPQNASSGRIFVKSFPNYWVATWENMAHESHYNPVYPWIYDLITTFQVILFDNGSIKYQYDYVNLNTTYTCGLNYGDGIHGDSYSGLSDSTDDFAIVFEYPFIPQVPQTQPALDPIVPNPDTDGLIYLTWPDYVNATHYYLYRDTTNITSVGGMSPIAFVSDLEYRDRVTTLGTYYYALVAGNMFGNSTPSLSQAVNVTCIYEPVNLKNVYVKYILSVGSTSEPCNVTLYDYSFGIYLKYFRFGYGSDGVYYSIDIFSRELLGGYSPSIPFYNHSWAFIRTDVSIGDTVPLMALLDTDHLFNVTQYIHYDLPGVGRVGVWVLEDQNVTGGFAWYEASTGLLIRAHFFYQAGGNATMEFVGTNAPMQTIGGDIGMDPVFEFVVLSFSLTLIAVGAYLNRLKMGKNDLV